MSSEDISEYEEEVDEPKQRKKRNPPAEPRKLMRWNPDVDQLLLLSVDAVCARLGIALPWEEIAKEVNPHLSSEGVKQHIGKIRMARVMSGRKVPDKPEKSTRRKSRASQIKQDGNEEVKTGTPTKLAGLLYHGPETQPKKIRTPKSSASAATPGGSTRKAGRKRVRSTLDREAILGTPSIATPTKVAPAKRGRKSKAEAIEEEDSDYAKTPTKKVKTESSYNFRAATKDVTYADNASLADDEEEEDDNNLITQDEDGDGEFRDDDAAAKDDEMEDVKSQHAPASQKSKNADKPLPPVFKLDKAVGETGDVKQTSQQSPMVGPTNFEFQPQPVRPNPFQANSGGLPGYHHYGPGLNAEQGEQDPFGINTTARGNVDAKWVHPGMVTFPPRPEESAMRSTFDQTPRALVKEATAAKEVRPKITRKATQEEVATPEKREFIATRLKTPIGHARTDAPTPAGSPFDTIEQTNSDIDAMNDMLDDIGMNNYTTSASTSNMGFYPNPYAPGAGFYDHAMGYYNKFNNYGNGVGMSMADPNFHINANVGTSFGGANGFISSPDEYNTSAGAEMLDNPLNFASNMTYPNHLGGLPMANNSGASTQHYPEASAFVPAATKVDSFDSTATTVRGSQTDQAKPNLNVDGGNDSQVFDDGTEYDNFGGGSFDEHFDDLFPDSGL